MRMPATSARAYRFASVRIGGGGFVSGLLYQPAANGLLYARTDVGGAYRWDQIRAQWTLLAHWLPAADNNLYGVDSVAVDPSDANRLYLLTGTYTYLSAGNGAVLISTDRGAHFTRSDLPFPMGGNEQGRNDGERLGGRSERWSRSVSLVLARPVCGTAWIMVRTGRRWIVFLPSPPVPVRVQRMPLAYSRSAFCS